MISSMHDANINVWMLTGDKLETAENIGNSSKLIKEDFKTIVIREEKDVDVAFGEIKNEVKKGSQSDRKSCALIIDGPMLDFILRTKEKRNNFIKYSKQCESVICCRTTPKQKADVVKMIKYDDPKTITLAIGDGANDVSMIKSAHVGIGLFGNEGRLAA